jgi:predicted DNA-binding transcriptional regulator YafY
MGVPLAARPGPHGGYEMLNGGGRLPLSLSVDEALGMILSYEALLAYADSPFSAESLSAVTRLRAALPPDAVPQLDRLRRHVAVVQRAPEYRAPFLPDVLGAAVDGIPLDIVYASRRGVSRRRIHPFGVFAEHGFWYCACHDRQRGANVALRADRFKSLRRVDDDTPVTLPTLRDWLASRYSGATHVLPFRARVTREAALSFELTTLLGVVEMEGDGETIVERTIPVSELEFYARHLLAVGPGLIVESPPELIRLMRARALEIARLYRSSSGPHSNPPPPEKT